MVKSTSRRIKSISKRPAGKATPRKPAAPAKAPPKKPSANHDAVRKHIEIIVVPLAGWPTKRRPL
jgi:hypothetical protein